MKNLMLLLGIMAFGFGSGCGRQWSQGLKDDEKTTFTGLQSSVVSFQFDTLFAVDVDPVGLGRPDQGLIPAIQDLKAKGICKKSLTVTDHTTVRTLTGKDCPVTYISELTHVAGQNQVESGYLKIVLQSAQLQAVSDLYFLEIRNSLENGVLKLSALAFSKKYGSVNVDGRLWSTETAAEYEARFQFPAFQADAHLTLGYNGKVTGSLNGESFRITTMTGLLQ